jgi:hypothetical protein
MNPIARKAVICLVAGAAVASLLAGAAYIEGLPPQLGRFLAFIMAPGIWLEVERSTPYHASTLPIIIANTLVYAMVIGLVWYLARSRRATKEKYVRAA